MARETYVWTCCQCGDSGMEYYSTPGCPSCGNYRCDHCTVQAVKAKKSKLGSRFTANTWASTVTRAVPRRQVTPAENVVAVKTGASMGSKAGNSSSALGPLVGTNDSSRTSQPGPQQHSYVSAKEEPIHTSASPESQQVTNSSQPTMNPKERTPLEQNNSILEKAVTGDDGSQRQPVQKHLQSRLEKSDFVTFDEILHQLSTGDKSVAVFRADTTAKEPNFEYSRNDRKEPEFDKEPSEMGLVVSQAESVWSDAESKSLMLQDQTNVVLSPTPDDVETSSRCRSPKNLLLPELIDKWLPQWLDFLLETPAPLGAERIRWTCGCGKRLYDDYHGLTPAKSETMRIFLDSSASFHQAQSTETETQTSTSWVGRLTNWAPSVKATVQSSLVRSRDRSNVIPMHNVDTGCPSADPQSPTATLDLLFLLFCVQIGKEGYGKILQHAKVDASNLRNDNELFDFLSQNYRETRNLRSRLSLRTVTEIGHCKVFVDFSNFISDLQRHFKACPNVSNSSCECWPPSEETGYCYMTQRSAEPYLMGKNYLLHHFHNPGCLDPRQNSVLSFVPIKKDSKLEGAVNRPMHGWGIYFEEGWDMKTICVVVTVLMIVVSLILGITWWKVESDFSGGWGVASFCVTAATLVVTVLVILGKQSY